MDKAFSIRNPLQGELLDFVQSSGFHCHPSLELIRDLTCLLSNYREEDVPVFPEVFVMLSAGVLSSIAPGMARIRLGTGAMATAAEEVLKDCATLAVRGWAVYVVKLGENLAEYGVFRSLMHSYASSAEEAMVEAAEVENSPAVVLIRNRGLSVVELKNGKNDTFTASFTSAISAEPAFAVHVETFSTAVGELLDDDRKTKFVQYFCRLITSVLQDSHGTLLAAHTPSEGQGAPPQFADGVWLDPPIDLAGAHAAAISASDAQSLAALQSLEALVAGMINSDGVVVFGTNGTVLGYRIFLKPTDDEKKELPDQGGGRRRTYALMQRRLDDRLRAAFFRSQDGKTECESNET